MNIVLRLVSRNTKVFFRDRMAVFFSFLSVIIIIMLYALFLGETNVNSIQSQVGGAEGVRWLVDTWIMAGILVVSTITVTLGVFGIMVKDQEEKRLAGFLVAPVGRSQIVMGYLFSAWLISTIMAVLAFVLGQIVIVADGGQILAFISILKVLGLIVLNVFSSSAIVFFLIGFIKSTSGFSSLSAILGTLIGFITGIYIPIGVLPAFVQTITKIVPATHGTVLMRQVFMEDASAKVFAGAPAGVISDFNQNMGSVMMIGGQEVSALVMIAVLIFSGLIFFGLSVLFLNRKQS